MTVREPLERAGVLDKLRRTVRAAEAGRGSVALVTGEAGIGKTSVVRAFTSGLRTRVLAGACDDLLTPRPLGPLRDMAAKNTPLAEAVACGDLERIFDAVLAELSGTPTVLVVEDLHWADDVTLDVLGYLARRIATLPALLLLTFRDDEAPLRWLGTLAAAPTHRLPLSPLSPAAVERLATEAGRDVAGLHALTGGNPFYVTEMLYLGSGVPVTVADVVLARVARLEPAARAALEQLAVLPGVTEYDLAERLLGPLDVVAEAEGKGLLEVRPDGLAFRHELTRRAVCEHLPELRRRSLHANVLGELPAGNPARLVHHAVCADDAAAVLAYAPRAGREAAAAGAHREALAHFTAAMRYEHRLDGEERARLHDDHAWELYNAHRFTEAVTAGERAVALHTDPEALAQAQVRLSRHYYMAGDTAAAETTARKADDGLAGTPAQAYAATYHGAVLALTGDRAAQSVVDRALRLAHRANRVDLVELGLNYLSMAHSGLDADGRIALLRESLALALHHGHHEHAARAYTNLGELLYRHTRLDELARVLADGLAFTRDRGFSSHAYNMQVHEALLTMRPGRPHRRHVHAGGTGVPTGGHRHAAGVRGAAARASPRQNRRRDGGPAADGGVGTRPAAAFAGGAGLPGHGPGGVGLAHRPPQNRRGGPGRVGTARPPTGRRTAVGGGAAVLRPGRPAGACVRRLPRTLGVRPTRRLARGGAGAGPHWATRTNRHWNWRTPASRAPPETPCSCCRTWARQPPPHTSAGGCVPWACARCREARNPRRVPTRPA